MKLEQSTFLRRIVIPVLSRVNLGDITINHHYTGQRIKLHSFRHKGYWYYGRDRERESMELFKLMINHGDAVAEVGGHIGYVSLLFKHCVGPEGIVTVFEPGENNLPYIRKNVADRGIVLIEKAVGATPGKATFHLDPLTGQNNSLIEHFPGFQLNRRNAGLGKLSTRAVEVDVVTLDDFYASASNPLAFVKIDVEGSEWQVLQGMTKIISNLAPRLMIEVQANESKICDLLHHNDYVLFDDRRHVLLNPEELRDNVFGLHRTKDAELLAKIGVL